MYPEGTRSLSPEANLENLESETSEAKEYLELS